MATRLDTDHHTTRWNAWAAFGARRPGAAAAAGRAMLGALAAALALAAPAPALGAALGQFKTWHAQSFDEADGAVCSLWSQPEKSQGKYSRRGEVFIFVTHTPAKGSFDRVSFEIGYAFEESKTAKVIIGKQRFDLSTGGSAAWAKTPEDDRRVVAAMRGGRSMIIEGVSNRGTETRDTFSLYGFSAAHDAIGKACPR